MVALQAEPYVPGIELFSIHNMEQILHMDIKSRLPIIYCSTTLACDKYRNSPESVPYEVADSLISYLCLKKSTSESKISNIALINYKHDNIKHNNKYMKH